MRHQPVAKPHGLRRLKVGEPVGSEATMNAQHRQHNPTAPSMRYSIRVKGED